MDIHELRKQINQIDEKLVRIFDARMKVALEIGKYKKEKGLPVYDPAREQAVLDRQTAAVEEEMTGYVRQLYTTLFDLSRSYQQRYITRDSSFCARISDAFESTPGFFPEEAVVACPDIAVSYGQQACGKLFEMPKMTFFKRFEDVFQAVESGSCEYGVLPIETDAHGSLTEVYDLLRKYRFYIVRAVKLKFNRCLIDTPDTELSDGVNSKYIRFICIAKKLEIYPGANQMSLMLSVQHKSGALYHVMAKFAALGFNLTKLESRYNDGNDAECIFYIDLEASVCDRDVLRLLSELEAGTESFTYLGSYSEI